MAPNFCETSPRPCLIVSSFVEPTRHEPQDDRHRNAQPEGNSGSVMPKVTDGCKNKP
jgi:hypothetical protein